MVPSLLPCCGVRAAKYHLRALICAQRFELLDVRKAGEADAALFSTGTAILCGRLAIPPRVLESATTLAHQLQIRLGRQMTLGDQPMSHSQTLLVLLLHGQVTDFSRPFSGLSRPFHSMRGQTRSNERLYKPPMNPCVVSSCLRASLCFPYATHVLAYAAVSEHVKLTHGLRVGVLSVSPHELLTRAPLLMQTPELMTKNYPHES